MMITAGSEIEWLVRAHPETVRVFERHGLYCAQCLAEGIDCFVADKDVAGRADFYGISLGPLLEELNAALSGSS